MNDQFHFGLEAEFMLADLNTLRPLWYKDVTFKTLDDIFSAIPLEGIPSLAGLCPEPPHMKLMPFIVEGYGVADSQMNIVDAFPKGFEIRTPVCASVTETLDVYSDLYKRVAQALSHKQMIPVAISHHPIETTFRGPQNKRRHDYWMWAQEVMTTYGPDINLSFPKDISDGLFANIEELNLKVNYYAPYMASLSLSSPFYGAAPWLIKGRRGKSYRTFKRSVIAPAIELHADENFRIEFKVFEMSKDVADFESYFHLVLGLFLCDTLKGQASDQERIYDSGHVARFGLQAEGTKAVLGELFESCEKVLPQFGFSTLPLKRLHQRFESGEHISDRMLEIFDEAGSMDAVIKEYSHLEDHRGPKS